MEVKYFRGSCPNCNYLTFHFKSKPVFKEVWSNLLQVPEVRKKGGHASGNAFFEILGHWLPCADLNFHRVKTMTVHYTGQLLLICKESRCSVSSMSPVMLSVIVQQNTQGNVGWGLCKCCLVWFVLGPWTHAILASGFSLEFGKVGWAETERPHCFNRYSERKGFSTQGKGICDLQH